MINAVTLLSIPLPVCFPLQIINFPSFSSSFFQMGESPIIRAAHNGHLHTVRFLVEHGADVNAIDMGDNTALHWAAMRGHVEIVKYLLEQGADKTLRNKQDKLAVDLCQPCWSTSYRFAREVLAA